MSVEPLNVVDISMKALIRECPDVMLRLANVAAASNVIRLEDPNINLPELRAGHVFTLENPETGERGGIYLEYQLNPDTNILPDWFAKCAGLTRQLGIPVVLLAIYLLKGERATFPDRCLTRIGGLETEFRFSVIRLWEHAARIESGEFVELAPLLILCQEKPTEKVVRREVELIRTSGLPEPVQADLLALAARIAGRNFTCSIVQRLFKEVWLLW